MDVALRHSLLPSASRRDLEALASLIEGLCGVHVPSERWITVFSRLDDLISDAGGVSNYCCVLSLRRDAQQKMVDILCPHETSFFREAEHWAFLRRQILPKWRQEEASGERKKVIRAWSAACSTGEEAYSAAMLLLDELGPGWEISVLGTDFSEQVLQTARRGIWPLEQAAEIPAEYRRRFMLQGRGGQVGTMTVDPVLRSRVHFESLNLTAPHYWVHEHFDLIFCRNVLIYFSREKTRDVIERLTGLLSPGGYLVTGHSESIRRASVRLRKVGPTIYQRLEDER